MRKLLIVRRIAGAGTTLWCRDGGPGNKTMALGLGNSECCVKPWESAKLQRHGLQYTDIILGD
ncbi:hypothetical protein HQ563_16060 [bacterium]|nr:hypothetical protein [bacterium]